MNLVPALARLSLSSIGKTLNGTRNIATNNKLFFQVTPCLLAEPLKKKKRLDPAIIKQREDRKKKKIEKQIRKLEKSTRQLKPIEECEVPIILIEEKKERQRKPVNLTAEILEQRILLEKKWAIYKRVQHLADIQMMDRIAYSQQHALDELRKESEDLYQEAIQMDFNLIPYNSQGPVNTPPLEDYESPDGDYKDISRKWE